jgi:hypothetical protein
MSIAQYFMLSTYDFSFLFKIKEYLKNNRQNIYLFFGVLLVGILAFESGFLRGQLVQSEPLIISLPTVAETQNDEKTPTIAENQSAEVTPKTASTVETPAAGQCPFVGSRNSNKYHLSTCAVAKRIKSENKICFVSKEDAEKRGYIASCLK